MCWFFFAMRRADTPIDPREPVSNLVTGGPFRYTRNPAYLSMAMIYTGISSLVNVLPSTLLLPAVLLVIQRGVIEREERYLERKFGEEDLQNARDEARIQREDAQTALIWFKRRHGIPQ